MDKDWLVRIYEEAGLSAEDAERAARESLMRLLRRERPKGAPEKKKHGSLVEHLVRDPLISMIRIIGRGDERLPFIDDRGSLSMVAFSDVFSEAGLDPVVAMAYAKVVAEAYEPKDLYQPLWEGLGKKGDVRLDELRRLDWSPIRQLFPDFKTLPTDQRPTEITRAKKPTTDSSENAKKAPPRSRGRTVPPPKSKKKKS